MSFLLDALKKSEQETNQTMPDVFAQQSHAQFEFEENEKKDYFKPIAIVVIFILAILVAFLFGRQSLIAEPEKSESNESVVQTKAIVSSTAPIIGEETIAKTVDNSNQQATSPQKVNTPDREVAEKLNVNFPVASKPSPFSRASEDPNAFNQQYSKQENTPAKRKDVSYNLSVVEDGIEEGKRLTGTSTIEESAQVSSSLLKRFEKALADTAQLSDDDIYQLQRAELVQPLTDMPLDVQDAVPSLSFQTHIYSSEPDERWLKVNDKVMTEGEMYNADLQLIEIQPQLVIMSLNGDEFSLPALSDW